MATDTTKQNEFEETEALIPLPLALGILGAIFVGTIVAVMTLESWLPGLALSLLGPQPHAYWDLARTGGIVAYLLIWMSIVFGLLITNKFARIWPGGPLAMDMHQFMSLLGFAFALFHSLILLGDKYINFSLLQLAIPFASVNYQPLWVGLGQIAFYLMIPVTFSFYFRKHMGYAMWRAVHYGSFIVYSLITVHALLAGSDTTNPGMLLLYAGTGAVVYLLTFYRVFTMRTAAHPAKA